METSEVGTQERRRAARALAGAAVEELQDLWSAWSVPTEVEYLREPEAGLVMVQGRIGGAGDRFNLGEATVTRATVKVTLPATDAHPAEEAVGTSYVLGSHPDHAGLAAIFDALLVAGRTRDAVLAEVITPLETRQETADERKRREGKATVVDFFTVARENSGDEEDEE
ncbi:phosphonate C-P lyase system protein PhnG [Brevibacterium litoralis]|uniref:phosphonate C-P lyase system protein PhnG n=1 Tax=Brevibacterium litoralis TaxID=3138935 RepID=UPI0032EB8CC1